MTARARRGELAWALLGLVGVLVIIGAILDRMVLLVISQLPELAESASDGVVGIERLLQDDPPGLGINGIGDAIAMARDQRNELEGLGDQALRAGILAFETIAGSLLLLVVLFCYLKDGPRLVRSAVEGCPAVRQPQVRSQLTTAWTT